MNKEWPYKLKPMEVLQTDAAQIYFTKDEILVIEYKHNIDFSLDMAKKLIELCTDVANGNKVLTMVITGTGGKMHPETLDYLSGQEVSMHRIAVALIITSLPHRIVANFIVHLRKKYYPTKLFNNTADATQWLKKFKTNAV